MIRSVRPYKESSSAEDILHSNGFMFKASAVPLDWRFQSIGALARFKPFLRGKRGQMNYKLKAAVIAVLAASLVGSNAYAGDPPPPAKKQTKAKKPPKPT